MWKVLYSINKIPCILHSIKITKSKAIIFEV
jgi:hypothetical protein